MSLARATYLLASLKQIQIVVSYFLINLGKFGAGPVPMTKFSTGGRYCSIITVDKGKAFFLDFKIAKIATAGNNLVQIRDKIQFSADRQLLCFFASFFLQIPIVADQIRKRLALEGGVEISLL